MHAWASNHLNPNYSYQLILSKIYRYTVFLFNVDCWDVKLIKLHVLEHLQRKLCKSRVSYDFTKVMHIMYDQRCWSNITAMTLLLKSCIFCSWTFPSSFGWTFSLSSDFNLINFLYNKASEKFCTLLRSEITRRAICVSGFSSWLGNIIGISFISCCFPILNTPVRYCFWVSVSQVLWVLENFSPQPIVYDEWESRAFAIPVSSTWLSTV